MGWNTMSHPQIQKLNKLSYADGHFLHMPPEDSLNRISDHGSVFGCFFLDKFFDDPKRQVGHSIWLIILKDGAGEGNRTLDTELGKLVLYHWATPAFAILKQYVN